MPLLVSSFLMNAVMQTERIEVILMPLNNNINTDIIMIALKKNNIKNL